MNTIVFEVVGLIENPEEHFQALYEEKALAFAEAVERAVTIPGGYILHWVGYVGGDLEPKRLSIRVDIYHQGRFRIPKEVGGTCYIAGIKHNEICVEDEGWTEKRPYQEVVSTVVKRINEAIERHRVSGADG